MIIIHLEFPEEQKIYFSKSEIKNYNITQVANIISRSAQYTFYKNSFNKKSINKVLIGKVIVTLSGFFKSNKNSMFNCSCHSKIKDISYNYKESPWRLDTAFTRNIYLSQMVKN